MPKKTKLEGLKIQSFVTTMTEKKKDQVKGGQIPRSCNTCPQECASDLCTLPEVNCTSPAATMAC
jgi:hypothetical protein